MQLLVVVPALAAAVLFVAPRQGDAHGMVLDPINRVSMWRRGWRTPRNYNDNQQYCGGFHTQWSTNKGKCGECGDNFSLTRPRPSENMGVYGRGIPVAEYKSGASVNITVKLTANHKGKFVFKLCPLKSLKQMETQECFDAHPLELAVGGSEFPLTTRSIGNFSVEAHLPKGISCDLCVLQWTYTAGNNWGYCKDGHGEAGCGPQETYRTCSDIKIVAP